MIQYTIKPNSVLQKGVILMTYAFEKIARSSIQKLTLLETVRTQINKSAKARTLLHD